MTIYASAKLSLAVLLSLCAGLLLSCTRPKPATGAESSDTKRYHLTGRVISIDKPGHSVTIDGDEIPGFMLPMQMPYTVKDPAILDKLSRGDLIAADVVVRNSNEEAWLENVAVTGHQAPAKPAALQMPTPNQPVPDFQLVNQDGKSISLAQYRGKALLVTFIYTQCPFPDFCPRVTGEFAQINRELRANPALYRQTHLLSISFDPAHDTPKALRDYAFSNSGSKQPSLFDHWEFAVAPAAQLPHIAGFFGLSIEIDEKGGAITHSLSTAVIGPDGKIFKWYPGNDWQPADLIKDAALATHTTS